MELQKNSAVLSGYHTIAVLNEAHRVFLVQHQDTHKIYVKKQLEVYNPEVYRCLRQNPVPGVPRILECCEEQGQLTVIEEYISGDSLEEKLQTETFTIRMVIRWMTELSEILERLHQMKPPVIHRDIKPSNVIITGSGHAVLLDFNAAKQYSREAAIDTVMLGTQGYAAPEQYGFGASSPQTDIYALGVLLRELLGKAPESERLQRIADRCTRLSPEERYQSVREFRDAIAETVGAVPGSPAHSAHTEQEKSTRSFLPPGFRSHTPWKMHLAAIGYLAAIWLSMCIQVENGPAAETWLERGTCLSLFLAVVSGTLNYRNIQRIMPLCRMKSPILRWAGVLILDSAMVVGLYTLMLVLEAVVFHR